jgi:hypothetical protein
LPATKKCGRGAVAAGEGTHESYARKQTPLAASRLCPCAAIQVIAKKETGSRPPIVNVDGASFLYTRHANMFFVAVTKQNVNPGLAFMYLFQMIR